MLPTTHVDTTKQGCVPLTKHQEEGRGCLVIPREAPGETDGHWSIPEAILRGTVKTEAGGTSAPSLIEGHLGPWVPSPPL